MAGNLSTVEMIGQLWPFVLAFITLTIILAKMDVRLGVAEEKIKTLFELTKEAFSDFTLQLLIILGTINVTI